MLVNNAGITGERTTAEETTPAHFLPVFGTTLLGPVRVTHASCRCCAGPMPRGS